MHIIKMMFDNNDDLKIIQEDGLRLKELNDEYRNNKEIVMIAVIQNGLSLQYASYRLRCDKEIVMIAVSQNAMVLKHVGHKLRNDIEVVIAAYNQNRASIQYLWPSIFKNKKFILLYVKKDANIIQEIPHQIKNRKLSLLFIRQWYLSLYYLHSSIKCNFHIVKESVRHYPSSIKFASYLLQNNKKIAMKALERDVKIIGYIPGLLRKNRELILRFHYDRMGLVLSKMIY